MLDAMLETGRRSSMVRSADFLNTEIRRTFGGLKLGELDFDRSSPIIEINGHTS